MKKAVRCPECQKVFNYYESENRPFCSDLCQKIDLNMWFDEEYKVPSQEMIFSDEEEMHQYE